jgi:hypothetical protein
MKHAVNAVILGNVPQTVVAIVTHLPVMILLGSTVRGSAVALLLLIGVMFVVAMGPLVFMIAKQLTAMANVMERL